MSQNSEEVIEDDFMEVEEDDFMAQMEQFIQEDADNFPNNIFPGIPEFEQNNEVPFFFDFENFPQLNEIDEAHDFVLNLIIKHA